MEVWNTVILVLLSWVAAHFSVGHKWTSLQETSLPKEDSRPWLHRLVHRTGVFLSFEAFWRAFYINLAFAGASMAAVTTGYSSVSPFDAWKNPQAAFVLCVFVGIASQRVLRDEVLDKLTVSFQRLAWVVLFGVLDSIAYCFAVILSFNYSPKGTPFL